MRSQGGEREAEGEMRAGKKRIRLRGREKWARVDEGVKGGG